MVEMLLQRCTVQQAIAKGRKDGAAKRRPPRTKFLDNNASRESKRDPNIWHRAEKLNYQYNFKKNILDMYYIAFDMCQY